MAVQQTYIVYPRTALLHSFMSWYNVRELSCTLKAMRKLNLSLVEHRAQALESLNALADDAPYGKDERFPLNGWYISEAHGDCILKFQQIRTSLAIKDHAEDKKTAASATGESGDMNELVYAAISSLFTQLAQRDFIFDRQRFEEHYRCEWGNPV
ncbi:hypothetical protein JTB14_019392 [Gonioctena quinquepunctata]|nr:hypothetical protein JTB14_019392 [Gonioctena quinquepunctata]